MASHNPVPSRVALNALRGVILTTSCSVILLAEERRGRLQLARAAFDNARKLHTVQNNRGPIAPAERHGSGDRRFVEIDNDVLSMASLPRPRTSTRRKGQRHMIGIDCGKKSPEHDSQRTQSIGRAEIRNESTRPSCANHFLGNGLSMAGLNGLNLTPWSRNRSRALHWNASRRVVRPHFSKHAVHSAVPDDSSGNKVYLASTETNEHGTTADDEFVQKFPLVEAAHHYLEKADHGGLVPRPYYDDVIPLLERLLADLEITNNDQDLHPGIISLGRRIFNTLASFGHPPAEAFESIRPQAIRFLRLLSRFCPEDITATFLSLLPLSRDPLELLMPLTTILQDNSHHKTMREVLLLLSYDSTTCPWERGELVCHLLSRHARFQHFVQVKQLYLIFQECGLFGDIQVPQDIECKIRSLMANLALESGEDDFANAELLKLEDVDLWASMSDMRLKKHIIARKASSGNLDQVLTHIGMLRQRVDPQDVRFQRLLTEVTDVVVQSRETDEVEAFLRKAATDFNLRLEARWFFAVLDGYAGRRQADSVFSWLQFCGNSGMVKDRTFDQRFFARCRKYWCFSDKSMQWLKERLLNSGDLATYEPAYDTTPASRLRQAVVEELARDKPDMQRASSLIRSAHDKGCDISEALTPLLKAQLEGCDDPRPLIEDALQMGVRLHDSNYNKAAQLLSAGGNHKAAAAMCELAARENGKGKLLYNQYNFANLVFAYTGSANYTALQSVLSELTSEVRWWHGGRICKESIKLAMKTAAMRAVAHRLDSEPHEQALKQLDIAFLHVKKCRCTFADRAAVAKAYLRFSAEAPPLKASGKPNGPLGMKSRSNDDAVRDTYLPNAHDAVERLLLSRRRAG